MRTLTNAILLSDVLKAMLNTTRLLQDLCCLLVTVTIMIGVSYRVAEKGWYTDANFVITRRCSGAETSSMLTRCNCLS